MTHSIVLLAAGSGFGREILQELGVRGSQRNRTYYKKLAGEVWGDSGYDNYKGDHLLSSLYIHGPPNKLTMWV